MVNNFVIDLEKKELFYLEPNLLPGFYGIFTTKSEYCFLNEKAANWLGFRKKEDAIGLTHLDIKCKAAEISHTWVTQEELMLESKLNGLKFLSYQSYANDDWKLVIGEKKFISYKNKTYILCYITDITNCNLIDISAFLKEGEHFNDFFRKQFCYSIMENLNSFNFTKRQSECLFYLVRGKSLKQIGYILNISQRTVEEHIDNAKILMKCASKSSLIEKLIFFGFMNFIPESLFKGSLYSP